MLRAIETTPKHNNSSVHVAMAFALTDNHTTPPFPPLFWLSLLDCVRFAFRQEADKAKTIAEDGGSKGECTLRCTQQYVPACS